MTDEERDDEGQRISQEILNDYLVCIKSLVASCEAGAITKMQLGQIMYACGVALTMMGLPESAKEILGKSAIQYAAALNKLTGSILE